MVHFVEDKNDHLLVIGGVGLAPENVVNSRSYSCVPTNSKFVYTNEVHTVFLADNSEGMYYQLFALSVEISNFRQYLDQL